VIVAILMLGNDRRGVQNESQLALPLTKPFARLAPAIIDLAMRGASSIQGI
jgi:hypothetical protein